MSARYGKKDGIKTAVTALIVGIVVGVAYSLPAVVSVPVLIVFTYWCGVLDGRATRRGARVIELAHKVIWVVRRVPAVVAGLFHRPAGGPS